MGNFWRISAVFALLSLSLAPASAQIPGGGVTQSGPVTTGDCVKWLGSDKIADSGGPCGGSGSPGGTNAQVQYNNAGSFGGFTVGGDATLVTSTGALTVTKSNGVSFGTAAFVNTGTSGATLGLLNAANTWSATQTLSALTLSAITGSTQCLQVNSSGVVSGTGTACGAGGGGTPGGTSGQIQFNSAGSFGGFTASGDATINTGTGVVTLKNTGPGATGPIGSATVAPIVTIDAQGRVTALSSATITQPAAANPTATAGPTANNGVATTFMRSDASPAVQQGSSSVKGIVQVDGTTITATAGVISATTSGGTVTSIASACGVSGGTITTSGTLKGNATPNPQTGTSYAIVDGDCGKFITFSNAAAIAATIAQAGGGGSFASGWFATLINEGAGTVTLTPATSTIDGAASLTLATNQSFDLFSDGTNYFTARGRGSSITPGGSSGNLQVNNGSGGFSGMPSMSGDVTLNTSTGVSTLKNTGPGATGPIGSATVVPILTIDAQGRATALTSTTITQPSAANPTATAGPTAVNGVASTLMRSDAAPAVQQGSSAQKGIVQVDNTSITAASGVIGTAAVSGDCTSAAGALALTCQYGWQYITGRFYVGGAEVAGTPATNSSAFTVGTARCYPGFLRAPGGTVTSLGGRINTTSAGSLIDMAVYANNPATARPTGTPLFSVTGLSGTTAAFVSGSVSYAFTTNQQVWFCSNSSNATVTLNGLTSTFAMSGLMGSTANTVQLGTNITSGVTFPQTQGSWANVTAATFTESNSITQATLILGF